MAEYQRFISYLYEYGQDGRKTSAGHLRVELKQGKCRMTVKARAARMEGKCKLCFYIRNSQGAKAVDLGEAEFANGEAEFCFEGEEDNLAGSKENFSSVNGLLFCGKGNYLAADWENEEVTAKEYEEVKKSLGNFVASERVKEPQKVSDVNLQVSANTRLHSESIVDDAAVSQAPKPDFWSAAKDVVKSLLSDDQGKEPLEQLFTVMDNKKEKIPELVNEASRLTTFSETTSGMEEPAPALEVMNQEREAEAGDEEAVSSLHLNNEDSMVASSMTIEEDTRKETSNQVENEPVNEVQSHKSQIQQSSVNAANAATMPYCGNRRMPWQDAPEAREILDTCTKMYPFQDGELAECVRIEPKDVGRLPMEFWYLGNNSFLIHSYVNYKYLLFGKRMNRIRCEYLLMIPGVYNQREKVMAKMFGFEHFKCSRCREQRPGEFGYWYLPLIF